MSDLSEVKVGDKLFVSSRLGTRRIEIVERITPTKRVVTKTGTFDRDGYLRGDISIWGRTRARLATEDDLAGTYQDTLVNKIKQFSGWDKVHPADLKVVAAIVDRYTQNID